MIKVAMTGVYVDDVAKAHAFYTDVLGFRDPHPYGPRRRHALS